MKYYFADFVLDTEIKQLQHRSTPVTLTKQSYDLLCFLLKNSPKVHTKDELVEHVWNGRIVSDNTIDQSISKLRKALNQCASGDYIEAKYGQGIQFVPEVSTQTHKSKTGFNQWAIAALVVLAVVFSIGFINTPEKVAPVKAQVIIVPSDEGDWIQSGTEKLLSQMMNYSGLATVVDFADKPRFVDNQQFLANQLKLKQDLNSIRSDIQLHEGEYQLTLKLATPVRDVSQTFNGRDLSQLLTSGMAWMNQQINSGFTTSQRNNWLPPTDHVAELYLRAMQSLDNNEFEKARKQLDLISEEAPDFYLAKYQLAQVLSKENKHDEAIALLNTLLQLPINDELHVASQSLKGYILDTQGKYDEATALFDQLFKQHQNNFSLPLLQAKYEHSYVLLNTNQIEAAEQQLIDITNQLNESDHTALLADARALKGSLYQRQGQMEQAQVELTAALDLFQRNQDALGAAKTYSALARIANHQANYPLAESYLRESLSITQSVGFKLGEGATLNELAYTLMVQGQHNKASQLVQQLDQIGSEIEYPAMQMAAKQLFFDMAREQKQWNEAERFLIQHRQIAEDTNNARAMVKNHMLELTLRVDAQQPNQTSTLVEQLQQNIDTQGEVRMQPRLDWLKARINWQLNNHAQAKALLQQAKQQALANEDGEAIININNTMAEWLLSEKQPQQALDVLNESAQHQPFALPYLKLKSQAYDALGQPLKALEIMNLCQQQSADLWTTKDSDYLKNLIQTVQSSAESE